MADKAKLLKIAQKHLTKGNLDKAIKTFQQLVEVDPRDQRLILRLAEIQARAGRKKEAIDNYEKVAAGYMKQDFTPKAIAVYKTILRLDPELFTAYEKLADLYKSQGLEAEALSQFENLFQVYERKNDEDKQIEVLKLMADMDPENLGFQVRLGETLAKKGHKKEAAEAFAKAAATLSRRGFHDRASQLFEKITALNPDNTAVRRELCAHYLESGQFNEARAEIEAILVIEPDDPRMVLLLGRILFQLGNKGEGEQKLSQSIQLFLESGELESVMREFLFVAQSHLRNGEIDEAEAFYRQIITNVPGEVRAIKGLVSVAETRKDRVGQIENLLALGRTMHQGGDREGAVNAYNKVNELDPLNEEAKGYIDGAGSAEAGVDMVPDQPAALEEDILNTELEEIEDFEEIEEIEEIEEVEEVEFLETREDELEDLPLGGALDDLDDEIEILELDEPEELPEVDLGDEEPLVEFLPEELPEEDEGIDGAVPDIDLEDFEDDDLVLEIPDEDEEGMELVEAAGEPDPETAEDAAEEMSLDELLAEADVYERYGLGDKAGETLERARSMAPDDQRVLERIAEFESGTKADAIPAAYETTPVEAEALVETPEVSEPDHDPYEEDLEEADFYHSQGLDDEAMRIYQAILERDPQHPRASHGLAIIEGRDTAVDLSEPDIPIEAAPEPPVMEVPPEPAAQAAPPVEIVSEKPVEVVDEPPPEVVPTPVATAALESESQFDPGSAREVKSKLIVADAAPEDMDGFLDIADELRSELADEMDSEGQAGDADGPISFEDIFSQFKKGIEETLGDEEYETHYNLGIAYKDMGLFDDAIREFESGARDPALAQDSFSLMAMCYVEQRDYESAVKAVEQAIEVSTESSQTGLFYQLGEVREKQKLWSEAAKAYEQVQINDPSFEGIADAVERARASITDVLEEEDAEEVSADSGMDDMLADLIREVEEMAKESSGETQDDPGKPKKDRISYL